MCLNKQKPQQTTQIQRSLMLDVIDFNGFNKYDDTCLMALVFNGLVYWF